MGSGAPIAAPGVWVPEQPLRLEDRMPPDTDPPQELLARLQKARKRVDGAVPASPEWAAAVEARDALEQQLHALRPTTAIGPDTLARLGPMRLADGCLIHGLVAAPGSDAAALRLAVSALPDRVASRGEFVTELETLAQQAGHVLEISGDAQELIFYAWGPA
jgi:hypothetical protein